MKRILALLLAAILCFGLVAVGASAAGDTAITEKAEPMTNLQRAVVETALAYHNRGHNVQYDSVVLTTQDKYAGEDGADLRETDFTAPEDATADETMFSVCSAFCFEVYYDAFGYQMLGGPLKCKTTGLCDISADDPMCVVKYDATGKDTSDKLIKDKAEAIAKAKESLQPGDWIVSYEGSGHAMLYIGDYKGDGTKYMAHCWGSKYSIDIGNDPVETYKDGNNGAIRVEDAIAGCFAPSGGTWSLNGHGERIVILRPLNVLKESDLTASAKARLKYPGINIDRTADYNRFKSVVPGDEITVTLEIQNCSEKAYSGLPVTELIPAGATLKAGSIKGGGTESGGKITWNLNLEAGKTATLSYTVTATGKRGDVIKLTGGDVGGIKDNEINVTIGGKGLDKDALEKLANITKYSDKLAGKKLSGVKFANALYQDVLGLDVKFVQPSQYNKNLFEAVKVAGAAGKMVSLRSTVDAANQTDRDMLIPFMFGGTTVRTGGNGHARILEFKSSQFLPGDVLIAKNGATETWLIAIGDGKMVYLDGDKLKTDTVEKRALKTLTADFFVGLRPTLAYDDLNTHKAAPKLPFTDVKEGDWYYEFVKELYEKGIVNGMTDTTFVPNGKLTYGQALKLIVCGLGKGEQATTGSHWASGYLTFAKNQKWLDKDVDLNGAISRLQFCQVAAKAKDLTAQPASNPFKDCADKDVLALVNAGIINGMSADTFAPDSTLTRAQISKIISGLIK